MSDQWRDESPRLRDVPEEVPPGIEVFEAPPLFLLHIVLTFHRTLESTGWYPRVLILRLNRVPALDRRGSRAIAMLAKLCRDRRALLVLSDVHSEAWRVLGNDGVLDEIGPSNVFTQWCEALKRARQLLGPA